MLDSILNVVVAEVGFVTVMSGGLCKACSVIAWAMAAGRDDSVCRLRHLLALHSNHGTCWHYTATMVPRPQTLSAPNACIMQNRVKTCILQLLLRMQCSQMQLLTTT